MSTLKLVNFDQGSGAVVQTYVIDKDATIVQVLAQWIGTVSSMVELSFSPTIGLESVIPSAQSTFVRLFTHNEAVLVYNPEGVSHYLLIPLKIPVKVGQIIYCHNPDALDPLRFSLWLEVA